MTVADTTIWVDLFRARDTPQTLWLERNVSREPIALLDLIFCEVLQGVRSDTEFHLVRQRLLAFDIFATGGSDLAVESARNYIKLRQRGITVRKTIDCLIATFCIREGHTLLHNDRDFDPFEQHCGLRVIHP